MAEAAHTTERESPNAAPTASGSVSDRVVLTALPVIEQIKIRRKAERIAQLQRNQEIRQTWLQAEAA